MLWLAVLIQTLYFILNRAYLVIVLFILLSLGLQMWKKTAVVYLLIPMLICQIVFIVWKRHFQKRHDGFLSFGKKKDKSDGGESKNKTTPHQKAMKAFNKTQKKIKKVAAKKAEEKKAEREASTDLSTAAIDDCK
jgi:hypothetical protein